MSTAGLAGGGGRRRFGRAGRQAGGGQSLPGGRSVVGGLLVAAAAVGTYAAHGAAGGAPETRYVVVVRDVPPGRILQADDLSTVPVDLPSAQRAVSFDDPRILTGTVTLGALRAGQLVQSTV